MWDKSRGGYRRARYGDMVILLRSMSGWSEVLVNVLMNEGIPVFVQARTGYFNTVEVETTLSLLSVVDNSMQNILLAAVMRSPIVGTDDEEMAWMMAVYKWNFKKGQDQGIYGAWKPWLKEGWIAMGLSGIPVKTAHSISFKFRRLSVFMERPRGEVRRLSTHEPLYRVYRESGYYDHVSAISAGETRRASLDILVEKTVVYESTDYKGLLHFVRHIGKLGKFDTDFGEVSVVGEQDNAVRIMSIHKSKGLGFPAVLLAGLDKRFNKQDMYGQILLDVDLGAAMDFLDLELRVKASTLKKQVLGRRTEPETTGEELRVLYVAMAKAKEKLIMIAADKSLENKLEEWKDIPLSQGQLPYIMLASADFCLDWLLMAQPAIPISHMEMRQVQVKDLVSEEITRQIIRKMKKEDLLNLDGRRVCDVVFGIRFREVLECEYSYESDIGLYVVVSVSELKKQSQIGWAENVIGTDSGNLEGIALGELKVLTGGRDMTGSGPGEFGEQKKTVSAGPNRTTLRGTAYHVVLGHIHSHEIRGLVEVKPVVDKLLEGGFLDQEAHDFINPRVIWNFLSSPLGKCMAKAQSEGHIHKEQQSITGIPAREMGLGDSDGLVLTQGIIDVCLEEEDGLVLIDYKTDHVSEGDLRQGVKMLVEHYRVQLDYYECTLTQLTGRHVEECTIYFLALQMSINV